MTDIKEVEEKLIDRVTGEREKVEALKIWTVLSRCPHPRCSLGVRLVSARAGDQVDYIQWERDGFGGDWRYYTMQPVCYGECREDIEWET